MSSAIATQRLVLRSAAESDRAILLRLAVDPDVRRYLGGPSDDATVAHLRTATLGQRWGSYLVEHRDDATVVGAVMLDRERGELEVSYQLLPEHWGHGYAAEAVRGLLGWAAAACPDEDHVIAVTQTANDRSRALLRRLGFIEREQFEEFGAQQTLASAPLPLLPS